jgi:DNA-binding NtrC family response regulator
MYLRDVLTPLGWQVEEAICCMDAFSYLREREFAVVVCESELIDGDWRDVLEQVARTKAQLSLIVTSRFADEYLWADVLNRGGWEVLSTPFEQEELLRVFDTAARRFNRGKDLAEAISV